MLLSFFLQLICSDCSELHDIRASLIVALPEFILSLFWLSYHFKQKGRRAAALILITAFLVTSLFAFLLTPVITNNFQSELPAPTIGLMQIATLQGGYWLSLIFLFIPIFQKMSSRFEPIRLEQFPSIIGYSLLLSGIVSPSVFSQIFLTLQFLSIGFAGFIAARFMSSTAATNEPQNDSSVHFAGLSLIATGMFMFQRIAPAMTIAAATAGFIFFQNLLLSIDIFRNDRIKGLLAFFVPLFLPLYVLRDPTGLYVNQLFYRAYSIGLILVTLLLFILMIIQGL